MTNAAPIAQTSFVGERQNGDQLEITVQIGQPYQCGPEEWACSAALHGLYGKPRDVHGGDAVQALCLAIRLALNLLPGFKEEGGRILFASGEDVPLEAYGLEASRRSGL